MRRISLAIIILLLSISCIFANGLPAEEAGRREKERQLEQVAERFKAETGFRGEITPNGALTHLGIYRGKFADIPFSIDADSTAFRHACERILDKVLPYTLATRRQLSMSRISINSGRIETDYYQIVNRYRAENRGLILIAYDAGRYRFSISNGTVELPVEPLGEIITEEVAKQIALGAMNSERYHLARIVSTVYTNESSDKYYLAYIVGVSDKNLPIFGDFNLWIDAINGKVMRKSKNVLMN
jgi:hypothetical protein